MKQAYRKIVNQLIKKSFPKLKGFKIIITEKKFGKLGYSAAISYLIFFAWLVIHPKTRKYSKQAVEALLAHELAHIDLIVNMPFSEKIPFAFNWLFTKKGKENFERDADIHTVKKGYGKGLLKAKKRSRKTYTKEQLKKQRKGYLSIKQIENLMKTKK